MAEEVIPNSLCHLLLLFGAWAVSADTQICGRCFCVCSGYCLDVTKGIWSSVLYRTSAESQILAIPIERCPVSPCFVPIFSAS